MTNIGDWKNLFWFWWFEEIGEFLSDGNFTNSGDNNSTQFCAFFVTNFGENFVEAYSFLKI